MIDRVELVALGIVIPDSGVDDDPRSGGHRRVRHADLLGRIGHQVVCRELGGLDQVQPFAADFAADAEARVRAARISQRGRIGLGTRRSEADLACVRAASGNELDHTVLIRRAHCRYAVFVDPQIFRASVYYRGELVCVAAHPVEGPHRNVAVIGHE